MSEHAAEASAVALPLSEPPVSPPPSALSSPPPQPAAAKASAANSAKKANAFERLVTLPPRSHVAGLTVRLIRGSIRTSSAARNLGADAATVRSRRSGGTGRRAGLKIRWPSGLVGSIPTSGIAPVERNSAPECAHRRRWGNAGGFGQRVTVAYPNDSPNQGRSNPASTRLRWRPTPRATLVQMLRSRPLATDKFTIREGQQGATRPAEAHRETVALARVQ